MMFRAIRSVAIMGAFSIPAGLLQAEEAASSTTFTIEMPALKYSVKSDKTKPDGGSETTAKTNSLSTVPLSDAYIAATINGKVQAYFYPFTDSKMLTLGYMVTDSLELGIDLGLNSKKVDKPKDESTNNTYGAYAWYYLPVSANTMEFFGILDKTNGQTVQTVTATSGATSETKTRTEGLSLKIGAQFVHPITKNFHYVGGISYSFANSEEKESKVKTTTGDFSIKIASVRMIFN